METWLREFFAWLPEGWAYGLLIGVIAFFESLPAVGLILPGSTLILFSGFLALHGKGSIGLIMGVAAVGAILGDIASYAVGARLGSPLLQTGFLRRRIGMVRKAELFFAAHGGKSVFFARFAGPVRGLVPFIAGCAQMRPGPFVLYALVSGILWGLAYPGLGYLAGASWQQVQLWSGRFSMVIVLLLVVTVAAVWWQRRRKRTASKSLQHPENSPRMPSSKNVDHRGE